MGLFSDTCMALVNVATGEALQGDDLEAAKKLIAEIPQKLFGNHGAIVTALAEKGWGYCGNKVSKRARFCNKCGAGAPGGWVRCPSCGKWVGNDSAFCWNCNHPLRPSERLDLSGGVWAKAPDVFAQRFEVGETASMLKEGVQVQEGTSAILLDAGKTATVLGPGRHYPAGALRAINWFGNPPPRSVVLVDSGDVVLPLRLDSDVKLRTAEEFPIEIYAEVTLRFNEGKAADFLGNLLKERRVLTYEEIAGTLTGEIIYAAQNLCNTSTVEDLVKDPQRREQFENAFKTVLEKTLVRRGLELVRVGAVDFDCAEYEKFRETAGQQEVARRTFEFQQKARELLVEEDNAAIAEENRKDDNAKAQTMRKAKSEAELADYLAQLAQEKGIGDAERDAELKLLLMAKRHEITAKEAEYLLAEKQAKQAEELADLEHDLTLKEKFRAFTAESLLKNAMSEKDIAAVKADEADIANRVARAKIDTEVYQKAAFGNTDLDLDERKGKIELDREERAKKINTDNMARMQEIDAKISEMDHAHKKELAAMQSKSEQEMAALKAKSELEKLQVQKEMGADQLLALAAGSSDAAAQAFVALRGKEKEEAERLLAEIKEMSNKGLERDERLLSKLAEVMSVAAKRPDPPPPPAPNTQIIH